MWFGGMRQADGQWMWMGKLKEPITAIPWEDNQPDNSPSGGALCMASWNRAPHTGKFHDAHCNSVSIPFICEKIMI